MASDHTVGILLALLSSIWIALVLLIAERVRQHTGTVIYSRSLYFIAAITLFLLAVGMRQSVLIIDMQDLFWLITLGLIPTIVGHTGLSYAIKYIRPTVVAAVPLGEPIIASLLALLIFKENVPLNMIIGGLATLTGLCLIVTHHK